MGGRGDGSDELGTLLQQPLALGYLVSTAPSGQLPPWFWASCPQRASERGNGIFLKSALHLHSHSVLLNLDDLLQQQSNAKQHPLDSQFTTDVLRYVGMDSSPVYATLVRYYLILQYDLLNNMSLSFTDLYWKDIMLYPGCAWIRNLMIESLVSQCIFRNYSSSTIRFPHWCKGVERGLG